VRKVLFVPVQVLVQVLVQVRVPLRVLVNWQHGKTWRA
jgi:hypothetical protein